MFSGSGSGGFLKMRIHSGSGRAGIIYSEPGRVGFRVFKTASGSGRAGFEKGRPDSPLIHFQSSTF